MKICFSRRSVSAICGAALSVALLASAPSAQALSEFTYGDLSGMSQKNVDTLLETLAIGADHRAFMPASPLGLLLGLDVGVDIVGIKMSDDFKTAMKLAGVTQNVPSLLPLPRLNIHKGLPFGVDVGFSGVKYSDNHIYGFEGKWAFLPGGAVAPAVALRLSDTMSRLYFMKTNTFKADVVASKGIGFLLEPYVGAGLQFASGDLKVPTGGAGGLPTSVSAHYSGTNGHVYVGLPIKTFVTKMTLEYDYSFAGISTYGAKFSLAL